MVVSPAVSLGKCRVGRHREERPLTASAARRGMEIHELLTCRVQSESFAALALRVGLRLFNALRAWVPRFARTDEAFCSAFPKIASRPLQALPGSRLIRGASAWGGEPIGRPYRPRGGRA